MSKVGEAIGAREPGYSSNIIWFPDDQKNAEKMSEITKLDKKTLKDVILEDLARGKTTEQVAKSKAMTVDEVEKIIGEGEKIVDQKPVLKITVELFREYLAKLGVESFTKEQLKQIAEETNNELKLVSMLAGKYGFYNKPQKPISKPELGGVVALLEQTAGNLLTMDFGGTPDQVLGTLDGVKNIIFSLGKEVKVEIRVSEVE